MIELQKAQTRATRTIETLGWFLSHAGTTEQTREMAEGVHNRRLLNLPFKRIEGELSVFCSSSLQDLGVKTTK